MDIRLSISGSRGIATGVGQEDSYTLRLKYVNQEQTIKDGEILAASMEERFSRKKHDNGFPELATQFCLDFAGITTHDLDYVVFYEKSLVKFERILITTLNTFPKSWDVWKEAMVSWLKEKLWIKSAILRALDISPDKIIFADHHMSHAASAFFTSPFDDAAVLTIDGVGEWTTTSAGVGRGRALSARAVVGWAVRAAG